MRDHVPVDRALQLPDGLAHVQTTLRRYDYDLRLRRSLEHPFYFVLERRCRRRPAMNAGMQVRSDMHLQARDGYLHVSTVHPNWLWRPWAIIRELTESGADLWETGADQYVNEEIYEQAWLKETRRRKRKQAFREQAMDSYDALARAGAFGSRTRISNAKAPAGEIPA